MVASSMWLFEMERLVNFAHIIKLALNNVKTETLGFSTIIKKVWAIISIVKKQLNVYDQFLKLEAIHFMNYYKIARIDGIQNT